MSQRAGRDGAGVACLFFLVLGASPLFASSSFNYFSSPCDVTPTLAASWQTVNASAVPGCSVPAGATGVLVQVENPLGASWDYGIRKKGSSDPFQTGGAPSSQNTWLMTGLDANWQFEIYTGSTGVRTHLLGYTMWGVNFFTNRINKTPALFTSYQPVNLSADTGLDTAIGAIFHVVNNGAAQRQYHIHMNGSGDDRYHSLRPGAISLVIVGVDAAELAQAKLQNSNLQLYLVGYVRSGARFFTNAVDVSTATVGGYAPVDLTGYVGTDKPTGALLEWDPSNDTRRPSALRPGGATYDYYLDVSHQWAAVGVDANDVFEEQIGNAAQDLYLTGYSLQDDCATFCTSQGAAKIVVETPEVKMVWDAGPNNGGGLGEFYAKNEANAGVSRVGDYGYNLFSTQLSEQLAGGEWHFEGLDSVSGPRSGILQLLETSTARVRMRQKYDYTPAIHLERDWTAYAYPRLAIDETLTLDSTRDMRGAQGLQAKGETTCPGNTFYCAGRSDETNRIWLTTDDAATYSDMLAIAYTSPFFGRPGTGYAWIDVWESGTPNSYLDRVWEPWLASTVAGSHTRFYLFYPHLAGLTSAGSQWQPYENDYRTPDALTVLPGAGSGWFDPSENTVSPTDFFNEAENAYALDLDPVRGLGFDIDGVATIRKKPFFKMRQWRSLSPPAFITLEGATLTRDVHYRADVKPIARGHFCAPACTELANGGLVGGATEYLNDPAAGKNLSLNFTGSNSLYLGTDAKFRGLNVALATPGAGSANLQWQYWDGASWANLEGVAGFVDETSSLKANGTIHWGADPTGWTPTSINGGPVLYYVRALLASGSYGTPPVESQIRTDILLFQYLGDITLDGQTFAVGTPVTTTSYRSIGTRGNYDSTVGPEGMGTSVAATNGSTLVTGAATTWRASNRGRGDRITIDAVDYTILSVNSETQLTLSSPFTGATGSGKPYTIARKFPSLAAWNDCIHAVAACPGVSSSNLVADNRREVGIAYKESPFILTASLLIDGASTDALHDITLTADHGNRHYGRPGQGVLVDNNGFNFRPDDAFVTVEWLEITNAAGRGLHLHTPVVTPHKTVIRSCLIHNTSAEGIAWFGGHDADVYNNIIYATGNGIDLSTYASTVNIYNNTIYNCSGTGIVATAGTVTLRNNVAHTCTVGFSVPGRTAASSNNLSSDGTATGVNPGGDSPLWNNVLLPAMNFANAPGGDLHIGAGSPAQNAGADLSGVFTTDVDAGGRVPFWDIGADETGASTGPDLSITKDDAQTAARPGDSLGYVVTVTNNGPGAVGSVTVTDPPPPGVTWTSITPSMGTYNSGSGLWTVTLSPGQSETLTFTGDISRAARGQLVNTATVSPPAGLTDPDPFDNQAIDTDALMPEADLTLTNAAPDPVIVGSSFAYTLTVASSGPSDANLVTLTDPLPWGVDFVSSVPGGPTCGYNSSTRLFSCNLGTFAPGNTTVTINVIARSAGTITNTAAVSHAETDPFPTDNTDQATTTIDVPGESVRFLTVTSTSQKNVLEWLNPTLAAAPGYLNTQVVFKATGFPANTGDGTTLYTGGTAGGKGYLVHNTPPLTNGQVYYYAVFVNLSGPPFVSAGRFTSGRPFSTAGAAKWSYSTGATSMAPPGVGPAAILFASNDNILHAALKGLAANAGEWPPLWTPTFMNGPSQGRPSSIPVAVGAASRVAFLGSQGGQIYAIDADRGNTLWSPSIGSMVQAAPSAMFTAFGGNHDYVLVGTRQSGDNQFHALNLSNGSTVPGWPFIGTGPADRIGIIHAQASVDYATHRVYFTSYARGSGFGDNTVWCLNLDTGGVIWKKAYGDIATGPTVRGSRVYVGTVGGDLLALNTANGNLVWTFPGSPAERDGPVKSFVMPDRFSADLYFSTTNRVWSVRDNGATASENWRRTDIPAPSTPVLNTGTTHLYVGGGDGKFYRLSTVDGSDSAPFPMSLSAELAVVGSPTIDTRDGFIYVGTENGIIYALLMP